MEKDFNYSVLLGLKTYTGFIFNPLRLYEIFYDENSERRTVTIDTILATPVFADFVKKAKPLGNGFFQANAFKHIYQLDFDQKRILVLLKELFIAIVEDFEKSYNENDPYYSYVYATLILSIILAMPAYFEDALIFKFVHFCRRNFILHI